ncbi:hypothetical protein [Nitrospirillum sp. BR 11828]|uniref:hypothetical protein n=1 Tax=Nitrospirillum sp. BR 11828 TaxID=3104325 RepID=UPI002ACAD957|nr:hypothetical protein [Nitrospirillum sp. BR 11828]MDZ5649503.1 hypothetical protein [Nitrospirillum sp. BR 11828]
MSENPILKPLRISRTRAVMAGLGGIFILAAAGAELLPSTAGKAAPRQPRAAVPSLWTRPWPPRPTRPSTWPAWARFSR